MTPYFFLLYFFFFLNLIIIPPSHGTAIRPSFITCSNNVSCGSIHNIGYPFWGLGRPSICGRPELQLFCNQNPNPSLLIGTTLYKVLNINSPDRTITLAQDEFVFNNTTCPQVPLNNNLNSTLFSFNPVQNDVVNLTLLYQCPSDFPTNSKILNKFTCNSSTSLAYYDDDGGSTYNQSDLGCRMRVEVPVFSKALKRLKNKEETLLGVLNEGFRVGYEMNATACAACVGSGGACGSEAVSPAVFMCYCRYGASTAYPYHCPVGKSDKTKIHIAVGIGILGSAIIICALYLFYIHRYKKQRSLTNTIQQSRIIPSNSYTLSNLEKGDNYLGVNLFSYDELEEATKHFNPSKELGDGGFGTVYHAKLGDGREVAIKRLYENNSKRVQQFMNEIEILARLRHKNLVTLYGYSSQQSKELLLVYEYIPNGTVADHLQGTKCSLTKTDYEFSPLPWHTRLSIAIETASVLVYLHASDIIHRDVKTNNILLDNNFSVKVADFGLSRLFPLDVTHVSTSPQGTPGYVDPEYHHCYHLTDKSDVYSFGVVLVELVSSKPAVDMTRNRHEINLSNMAIHKIQNDLLHELVDSSLGFDSDFKVKKEVTRVAELAFQCLQRDREMRPTMEEVLEILTSIHQEIKIKMIDDENYVGVVQGDVVDIPVDEAFRLKSDLSPVSSPEGKGKSDSCSARTSQSSC